VSASPTEAASVSALPIRLSCVICKAFIIAP
jgi:hypothetical protein